MKIWVKKDEKTKRNLGKKKTKLLSRASRPCRSVTMLGVGLVQVPLFATLLIILCNMVLLRLHAANLGRAMLRASAAQRSEWARGGCPEPWLSRLSRLSTTVDNCRQLSTTVDNCQGTVELDSLTALSRLSRLSRVVQCSVVSRAVETVELSSCRGCRGCRGCQELPPSDVHGFI